MADAPSSDWFVAYLQWGAPGTARNHQVAGQAAKPAVITTAFTQHQPSAAIFGVHMVMANPGTAQAT